MYERLRTANYGLFLCSSSAWSTNGQASEGLARDYDLWGQVKETKLALDSDAPGGTYTTFLLRLCLPVTSWLSPSHFVVSHSKSAIGLHLKLLHSLCLVT